MLETFMFGRSPLGVVVAQFLAALFAFVITMNLEPNVPIELGRLFFGILTIYGVCDLAIRLNNYRWR